MKRDDIVNSDGLRTLLPRARGLSGAFVFEVRPYAGGIDKIWTPDDAKVIAMQISWNTSTWVKASNIKHLTSMLNSLTH